jgi:hypothetical protein
MLLGRIPVIFHVASIFRAVSPLHVTVAAKGRFGHMRLIVPRGTGTARHGAARRGAARHGTA